MIFLYGHSASQMAKSVFKQKLVDSIPTVLVNCYVKNCNEWGFIFLGLGVSSEGAE